MDELNECLADLRSKALELNSSKIASLESLVDVGSNGISLLDVRNNSLLSYSIHLTYLCLLKVLGMPLQSDASETTGSNVVLELVRLRCVLEKTKPLELKLKYQIDKLIKAAILNQEESLVVSSKSFNNNDDENPLNFKPNPSAMTVPKTVVETAAESSDAVYKPPRLVAMPYSLDGPSADSKANRLPSRIKEQASKSRLLQDLKEQFDFRPEELDAQGNSYHIHQQARKPSASRDHTSYHSGMTESERHLNDLEAFEEHNFIRLSLSKKDKQLQKKLRSGQGHLMRFQNEFSDLNTDFEQISGLHHAVSKNGAGSKRKEAFGGDRSGKRGKKFVDADHMVKSVHKDMDHQRDEFKMQKKTFKKFHSKKK